MYLTRITGEKDHIKIKIQHESFKYQMNAFFYLWEDHSIQWILFLFYSRFKIEMHVKNQRKDTLSL